MIKTYFEYCAECADNDNSYYFDHITQNEFSFLDIDDESLNELTEDELEQMFIDEERIKFHSQWFRYISNWD